MPTNIPVKNTNQMNQLKIVSETLVVDEKTKKKEWRQTSTTYLKPGEASDFWVGQERRHTITEMPT